MLQKLNRSVLTCIATALAFAGISAPSLAAPIYLNDALISVALGPLHAADPEPFGNLSTAASLANVIDAPTATASELHTQSTHVWVNGGELELVFDFGDEYDLSLLHFWNYHSEDFDVDTIVFDFFDAAMNQVGTLTESPRLGNTDGSDGTPITPEDYALDFPTNVRYVNAVLSGANGQVDFNNIGFTAELSDPDPDPDPVAEPGTLVLLGLGLIALGLIRRRRSR